MDARQSAAGCTRPRQAVVLLLRITGMQTNSFLSMVHMFITAAAADPQPNQDNRRLTVHTRYRLRLARRLARFTARRCWLGKFCKAHA